MNTKNIPTTVTGAICELIACAWLLKRGYDVFRNVSPTGKADLIALKDGDVTLIDVSKSSKYISKSGKVSYTKNYAKETLCNSLNIKVLYVADEDCFFAEKYVPNKILNCENCNNEFINTNNKKRFCTKKCRDKYHSSKK
jgi:Holliday junction resolvase-like predicted endonuclease